MSQFEEKTMKTEEIFDGKIIKVQVDDVLLPNGQTSKRELVKHPGAVAVIPVLPDGRIVFVKQYRKPLERELIEIPAGKIEADEPAHITAVRELEEEIGYTTEALRHVRTFATSPGFADEEIHLYYTNEMVKLDEAPALDEDEFVEVMTLTLEEAQAYVDQGLITDLKTIYAIAYLQLQGS